MADNIYDNLQPEVIGESLTWLEFFEAMSETVSESILEPIGEIERIRNIIETTDPVIVSNTIKDLGFNIPSDLIAHNAQNLARAIYMLPLYHETSGTTEFTNGLSFVLGRAVNVENLYTRDYIDFYKQAYGASIVDGGDWYKTTHIKLSMSLLPSDSNLILEENETVKDRLLEAFYEFAPINLVVHDFSFTLDAQLPVGITGQVVKRNKLRHMVSGKCVPHLVIDGPKEVFENSKHTYRASYLFCSFYSNDNAPLFFMAPSGINTSEEIDQLDNETILLLRRSQNIKLPIMEDGQFAYIAYPRRFGEAFLTDINSNFTGGWDGASWNGEEVGNYGPIIFQRNNEDWYLYRTDYSLHEEFEFELLFSSTTIEQEIDLTQYVKVPAVLSSNRSDIASAISDEMHFGGVSKNTQIKILAEYNGIRAEYPIIVKAYNDDVARIEIEGPNTVFSNTVTPYKVYSYSTKGIKEEITQRITLLSNTSFMEFYKGNNTLFTSTAKEDEDLYLSASFLSPTGVRFDAVKFVRLSYKSEGTYLVDLNTTITKPQGYSLSSALANPTQKIYEGDTLILNAQALYSDGTQEDVYPYWKSSSPALVIHENGIAEAKEVQGTLDVELEAVYQNGNVLTSSKKIIRIEKSNIEMESLQIVGPDSILEYSRTKYNAIVSWSEGYSSAVEAEWGVSSFSITKDGVLHAGSVDKPKIVTITARINNFIATKEIVVEDEKVILKNISIEGPDNVKEEVSAIYRSFANYSDGSRLEVQPVWSVVGTNNDVTLDQSGLLTFTSDRIKVIEIKATLSQSNTEQFVQTKRIVLVPRNYIISSLLLSGPVQVEPYQTIKLDALSVYEDGSMENVNPSWFIEKADENDPIIYADLKSDGTVLGRPAPDGKDKKVIVYARYFKEIVSQEITIIQEHLINVSPDVPLSSRIIGPAAFKSNETGSFAQLIDFGNECGEIAVSSDWEIDVSNDIAVIDENGYLQSINGASVPITVTATYTCGGYEVVDTFLVNIIAVQVELSKILIHGSPFSVLPNSEQPYLAEIFESGQHLNPSEGVVLKTTETLWEIEPPTQNVSIDETGVLNVGEVPDGTLFNIKVSYRQGFDTVWASQVINVIDQLPMFGHGPMGIDTEQEINQFLTNQLLSNNNEQVITLREVGKYGYFCHHYSLGIARFVETRTGEIGGWDGAGEVFGKVTNGPISILLTINNYTSIWYLYRTDNPITSQSSYQIFFPENR